MRILYDGYIFGAQPAGGISRYFSHLIANLPGTFTPLITVETAASVHSPCHVNLRIWQIKRPFTRPWRISQALQRARFQRLINTLNYDILHPTFYTLLGGERLLRRGPIVVTVHDMIDEIYPDISDPNGLGRAAKKRAILAADAIVCVSDHTRHDLLERIPVPESRIAVIPHGCDGIAPIQGVLEPDAGPAYFLYVGSRAPYKNFPRLAAAFARVISARPDVQLRVVGPTFSDTENTMIRDLGIEAQVDNVGHLTDAELAEVYARSLALVYPSTYEGFGIPPLEAMRCGTAVIAANATSIPEVVADAALLVDPCSVDDMADAMLVIHDSPSCRQRLVEAGSRRAAQFTWEKTAALTAAVYERVA